MTVLVVTRDVKKTRLLAKSLHQLTLRLGERETQGEIFPHMLPGGLRVRAIDSSEEQRVELKNCGKRRVFSMQHQGRNGSCKKMEGERVSWVAFKTKRKCYGRDQKIENNPGPGEDRARN